MSYGQPFSGFDMPTVGVTAGTTAATLINARIADLRACLESKVTPAGMDINADLSFLSGSTYSAAKNVAHMLMQQRSAVLDPATYAAAIYFAAGEWYLHDAAGRRIQITNAGALNVATTGGIIGSGYGSGGVAVSWDAVNSRYTFKTGSGADAYAALLCDDVLLRDGSGNAIRVGAPALAADYNFTLPAALPATAGLLEMSTAGALTVQRSPTLAAVTLDANGHVTVSGTGRYKHGELVKNVSAFGMTLSPAGFGYTYAAGEFGIVASSFGEAHVPVDLKVGERLIRVTVRVQADNVNDWDATLYRVGPSGTATSLATDSSVTGAGTTPDILTLEPASPETVASGDTYFVRLTAAVADTDLLIHGAAITYDLV